MAIEVIHFAERKSSLVDFKNFALIAKSDVGKSYYDRMRVAEFLIENQIIALVDDKFERTTKSIPEWLKPELDDGNFLAWELLDAMGLDESKVLKFEAELFSQIGLEGELFFIEYLRSRISPDRQELVKHISLTDDSKGFDIAAPSLQSAQFFDFWEVKTSTRPGSSFRFFISRNEYEASQRLKEWKLVAIQSLKSGPKVVGFLTGENLELLIPHDMDPRSRWHSVSINLTLDFFTPLK